MNSSKDRDKKRKEIAESILTAAEVQEILGFSRMRLNKLVQDGRIIPIRKNNKLNLYLKEDILDFKGMPRKPGKPPKEEQ